MATIRIKRIAPGQYTASTSVRSGGYVVDITYFGHLKGWVAAACWDRHRYSDPIATKRDAVNCARSMINDAIKAEADRMVAQAHRTMDAINAHLAKAA